MYHLFAPWQVEEIEAAIKKGYGVGVDFTIPVPPTQELLHHTEPRRPMPTSWHEFESILAHLDA